MKQQTRSQCEMQGCPWRLCIPELMQRNDAFVRDVPAGNDPQAQEAFLQVGRLAQPLQALVVDVHALAKPDFLNVLQAV